MALLLLGTVSILAQEGQKPANPGQQRDRLEDVVNIDLRSDVRLFTVMAAINAAGFSYEIPGKEMSAVRLAVRDELKELPRELLSRLRVFYTTHSFRYKPEAHSAYTSLALMLLGPPEFTFRADRPEIPDDVQRVVGFEELLAMFYEGAGLEDLWARYRADYDAELLAYRPVVKDVIRQTLDYFRIPARIVLDRKIVLMPDLLGYQDVVNARNLEHVYYIVVGPSDDPASNYVQVQHEYLHFLIDPLVEKYGGIILKSNQLLEMAHDQPNLGEDFRGRYILIVGESLIEALLSRLHPVEDVEKRHIELFRRGLVFVPYFERALEAYEQSPEASLPTHLETILSELSVSDIEKDAEMVAENEKKYLEEQAAQQAQLAAEEAEAQAARDHRNQINSHLNEAGELMALKRYSEAESRLAALLEIDPGNPNAHFYLAQIAAQQGRYEDSLGQYVLVEKAAAAEPWIRAVSMVRIGRILAHQGDYAAARTKFEEVLVLEGDLRGARERAEESLAQLPEK
jgi:tetratricopeptide (TPR) repeat protein